MPSLADLSPPPKAHIKQSDDIRGATTGYKRPPERLGKVSKNRRPTELGYSSPNPQKLPEDPVFTHFQEKAEEDSASCVFLLWGPQNSQKFTAWAVDVPTTKLESEDLIFVSLAQRYATELGFWRRWLSFRKFGKLKPVVFRLICRSSEKFLAFVEPLDLEKYHKIFSERKDKEIEYAESVREYKFDNFGGMCWRDSNGEYNHEAKNCPVSLHELRDCPFERMDWYEEQIRWIKAVSFLSYYFRYPVAARYQSILEGFSERYFLYQYENVRPSRHWEAQTRYLQLNGLYIETTWDPIKCLYVFFSLLICVLAVGRICWGSWEITFGAGSFFVALPMLALTVLSYYEV